MRGEPYNLDMDEDTLSLYATDGPQIHPTGVDVSPRLSTLARPETGSGTLDVSSSRALPPTGTATTVPDRLYGFFTPGPVEAVPTDNWAQGYGQVLGCTGLAVVEVGSQSLPPLGSGYL